MLNKLGEKKNFFFYLNNLDKNLNKFIKNFDKETFKNLFVGWHLDLKLKEFFFINSIMTRII
jgi:hypothetical protein